MSAVKEKKSIQKRSMQKTGLLKKLPAKDILEAGSGSIIKNYRKLFENNNQIVKNAHTGVLISAIADFSKVSDKSQKQIAGLIHTTTKTLQNYTISSKKLPTLQSELLLKLYALYDKGIEIFGSKEAFNKWLQKPAFGLYNQVPDSLLSTSTGINLLMDELTRIEYGEFA